MSMELPNEETIEMNLDANESNDSTVDDIPPSDKSDDENSIDFVPPSDNSDNDDTSSAVYDDIHLPSPPQYRIRTLESDESDFEMDIETENNIPGEYPPRAMKLTSGAVEFDTDYYNGWEIILDEDNGYDMGTPPFIGERCSNVPGVAPMDYFDYLFKHTMWGNIANETNNYALRKQQQLGPDALARMDNPSYKKHSRMNKWKPVTPDDIRNFAGHLILLGLIRKPELADYWSHKELTRTPFFGKNISRDTFFNILSNFHVDDDSGNPPFPDANHNALAKLQSFIDMCNLQFKSAFNPGENISIDEGCCPWRGRLRFKQFNPRKPHKYHMKIFQVSDPKIGYLLHFKVYTGMGSCFRDGIASNDETCNRTTKTVLTLCEDANVLRKGHCIYMDSYFTSVSLAEELFSLDTLCCGTARHRVGQPLMLGDPKNKVKLQPGWSCALRSGPVLCFKWIQDKEGHKRKSTSKQKEVYMLTTKHTAKECFSGRVMFNTQEAIYKPSAVVDYCHEMGGVDLTDQLLEYYHFLRKSCKWWRKLWVHIFNMVILNAFLLNKNFGLQNKMSQTEYRYILASNLINYTPVPATVASASSENAGHWPERLPISHTGKKPRTKIRKCSYCFVSARQAAKGATRKEASTSIICSSCRIPLCIYPCFGRYHIRNKIK